ncbi:MAG: hypothetical protein IJD92_00500 [Bacilli bacterium]|nr:hypothetical protein [Bacilli bacterium]
MFTKYIYNRTNKPVNSLREEIKRLELLKEELENKIIEIQFNCEHNLILSYALDNNCISKVKRSRCLLCDKYLELDDDFEMFSEKIIDKDCVLDITDVIKDNGKFYIEKAKEKLEEIIEKEESYDLSLIKREIREYLVDLNNEKKLVKRNG